MNKRRTLIVPVLFYPLALIWGHFWFPLKSHAPWSSAKLWHFNEFFLGSFQVCVLAVNRQRVAINIKINESFIRQDLSIHERLCTALCLLPSPHLYSVSSKWTAVFYSVCHYWTQWQLPGKDRRNSLRKVGAFFWKKIFLVTNFLYFEKVHIPAKRNY